MGGCGEPSVHRKWDMRHADGASYRDRERLEVVVDGNTTLSPLIAAMLESN